MTDPNCVIAPHHRRARFPSFLNSVAMETFENEMSAVKRTQASTTITGPPLLSTNNGLGLCTAVSMIKAATHVPKKVSTLMIILDASGSTKAIKQARGLEILDKVTARWYALLP